LEIHAPTSSRHVESDQIRPGSFTLSPAVVAVPPLH
jgi:hypothetical protein